MTPALFLDRDGVINIDKNYVHRIEDFEFIEGIFELGRTANRLGLKVVVITNQAGIGRGYYDEQQFHHLTDWMLAQFAERGVSISKVYFCPYHPIAGIGEYRQDSYDRKPNPGMILAAQRDLDIDLDASVLVGDKETDLQAGRAAGIHWNLRFVNPENDDCPPEDCFTQLADVEAWLERHFNS